jgi:hypothetical protein
MMVVALYLPRADTALMWHDVRRGEDDQDADLELAHGLKA